MTVTDYQRHKDRLPEQTIEHILGIINDLGWEIEEIHFDSGLPNCFSQRVKLKGLNVGANGKGVNPVFCRASALAELMERLQNDHFTATPLKAFQDKQADYYSVTGGRITRRPLADVLNAYNSNGMCAGNTPQEALVQGLAEIIERYCHCALLDGDIHPPEVEESRLQAVPRIYQTIIAIREGGRYQPRVFDLSLGQGWPVLMTMIHDLQSGRFGCRFACHPSFAVALERTFTESMQGRSLEYFANTSWADSLNKVQGATNLYNVLTSCDGCYPASMLTGEPSYSPMVFEDCQDMDNYQLLRRLTRLFIDHGHEILIRDAGFLGFPAYHILVPGFSELSGTGYNPKINAIIQALSSLTKPYLDKMLDQLFDFSRIDDDLLDKLASQVMAVAGNKMTAPMAVFCRRQFTPDFPGEPFGPTYLRVMIRLAQGRDEEARSLIKVLRSRLTSTEFRQHMTALDEYLRLLALPLSQDEAASWLRRDHAGAAEPIIDLLADRATLLSKVYPRLNCGTEGDWDCENCQGRYFCRQPEAEALARALNEKEAAYEPDYPALAALFAG